MAKNLTISHIAQYIIYIVKNIKGILNNCIRLDDISESLYF